METNHTDHEDDHTVWKPFDHDRGDLHERYTDYPFDINKINRQLTGARVGIVVIMLLSGMFVFLPFMKRCKAKKS